MTTLIIGGGWSGLAAAITLCQQGKPVHLIESAKQLGGRARNVQWQEKTVDNGQHLMIGAYNRLLTMMTLIGIDNELVFNRYPIDLTILDTEYPSLNLSAKGVLPWPLSLAWSLVKSAGVKGLLDVSRLQSSIPKLLLSSDISVSDWLAQTKQSDRFIKQLWEPMCLATLNTPIDHASAHLLAKVLQDSLGKSESEADLLIPKLPLGDLFPKMAAQYIEQHGGKISLQTRAKKVVVQQNKMQSVITQNGQTLSASDVIVALSPSQTSELLSSVVKLDKPQEYPICTVYLQYSADTRLPSAMFGLSGTISQWVFDRSEQTPGLMAVVISGPGQYEALSKEQLVAKVSQELHQLLPHFPQAAEQSFVIREKRATFACTVDIEQSRSQAKTDVEGLYLAGDFVANSYPATLEGAIRNGENAALR